MSKLPPQLQQKIMDLQGLQQRAETFRAQSMQLKLQLEDIEKATAEIDALEDPNAIIYKAIGAVLVRANKDKIKEELNDQKETIEMRIKVIEKQAEKTNKNIQDLENEVKNSLKEAQMGGFGGPM